MIIADMGIPMIFVTLPLMVVALLPIAGLESLVYRKYLRLSWTEAFVGGLIANLWSTLAGIPLTWLLLVIGQFAIGGANAWGLDTLQDRMDAVTLQAAWLMPYEKDLPWMIPAASIALLFPF
jgi:hypothetical protein